jgi:uncharacterized protein (DUF433 family)
MPTKIPVVHSDPEILSGTPVFVGTRAQQAIAALELARESVLTSARPA